MAVSPCEGAILEQLFADVGDFIERNRAWAGPILGAIVFGESMVLIGAFFPATVLMATAGGMIGAGLLEPLPVLLWCIAGAVLGDAVSYWLGRRLGPAALRSRLLRPRRRMLARARLFFQRYGAASIYLCRFMGPVRAFVPLMAGMMGMTQRRFQLANAGSALIWVPVMLAPGYLAAKGVSGLGGGHGAELQILAIVGGVVAAVVIWRLVEKRLSRLAAMEDRRREHGPRAGGAAAPPGKDGM